MVVINKSVKPNEAIGINNSNNLCQHMFNLVLLFTAHKKADHWHSPIEDIPKMTNNAKAIKIKNQKRKTRNSTPKTTPNKRWEKSEQPIKPKHKSKVRKIFRKAEQSLVCITETPKGPVWLGVWARGEFNGSGGNKWLRLICVAARRRVTELWHRWHATNSFRHMLHECRLTHEKITVKKLKAQNSGYYSECKMCRVSST